MKAIPLILLFAIFTSSTIGQESPARLVYRNDFSSANSLEDWKMEGPGVAKIEKGRLLLYSKWQPELEKIGDKVSLIEPGGSLYYPFLEEWVRKAEPEELSKYMMGSLKGDKFAGGHIQYWNTQAHPENFLIRLRFQAASPYPLHMMSFCGRGLEGEDVLDPSLAPRYGLGSQYMKGDIRNYRISYWSGPRGTSNMRRAPGRELTAMEEGDIPRRALEREVQLELFRWQGRVVFKCDGDVLVDSTDEDPFGDGYFSLRLMAAAKGYYDDYEVYELNEDPFSYEGLGERIKSRLSAQRDLPAADEIFDEKYIVVGSGEKKTSLHRNLINTHKGYPVYHFSANPDANRVELTTCYASNLEGVSEEEQAELSALANLYFKNDQGSYGDTITYDWYARFPEPLKEDAKGIFAQWHGRPDRTLVELPDGTLRNLEPKEFLALSETMRFDGDQGHIGIDLKTGEPNGWKSDGSAGGPIGAFKFQDGHMCLIVRSDPNARSDNRIKLRPKPGGKRTSLSEGNKVAAVVFEKPISEVPINRWIRFKVQIKYSRYRMDSDEALSEGFVKVWIDGEQVADWTGEVGKNDAKGPYFKYGIYKPGADGFRVDCAGFEQVIER